MLRRLRTGILGGRLLLPCLLIITAVSPQTLELVPRVCPGLQQGICTRSCQAASCTALARFFSSTFNESRRGVATKSWAIQTGWNLTRIQSCEQILSARSSRPSYCSWYGITCCSQEAFAQRQCTAVHSVAELKMQVNGVNGSVDDPAVVKSMLELHACGLTRLVLQGNDLSGSLSTAWGYMTNLTVLDLGNNWIQGSIPDAFQSLTQLTVLNLGTNFLSGVLPPWLGRLKALQLLSLGSSAGENPDGRVGLTGSIPASLADLQQLKLLNLESNALTGVLPPRLCNNSKLSILKLRANTLIGSPQQLLNCTQLTQLDISRNRFSGAWLGHTSSWNWSQLLALDASYNEFEGSIPDALYGLSVLSYLNLGYNRLSGSIRRSITLMQNLIELKLNNNLLSGVIDENLWYLPRLSLLDLSHNKLTGTISSAVGLAFALSEVILDNNKLSGSLPSELGILQNLKLMDIRNNTALSCMDNSSTAVDETCSTKQLLPCFMALSDIRVPRTDGSNLACPLLMRRPFEEAVEACSGDGPGLLGAQATNLADIGESEQKFELDPSYYDYQNCRCLRGYKEVWVAGGTVLTCIEMPSSGMPAWVVPSVVVSAVAAVMLLVAVALVVWLRMTVQLRPRWQREKELNEHRKRGMPTGGPASIVVTDVERYSDLMQANAYLTTKALGVHNAILRRAVAAQAGHVIEQEGDSWSVAFHTPMDAVAFCLQVQQALQKTNWPGDVNSRSFRGHKSFLSNAAVTAAESSNRSNTSLRGLQAGSTSSATAMHSSGRMSSHGQVHSVAWKQQVQVLRSSSGGSADLTRAASAATGAGNVTDVAAAGQLNRTAREDRGSGAVSHFCTLREDVEEGQQMQEQHKQEPEAATHSLQNSFSSIQSSPESQDASCRGASPKAAAAVQDCRASSWQSTPDTSTSSFQQLLQGFRNKIKLAASNSSSADLQGGSFSGTSGTAANDHSGVDAALMTAKQPGTSSASKLHPSSSDGLGAASTLRSAGSQQLGSINRFWSMMGMPIKGRQDSSEGQDDGVRGLRVRMGIATGWVPRDTDIGRCALFELAKAVSDMANGGQVLLEANTFHGVKNRLTELGTIDHRGYNDKLRANASRALWQQTSMSCLTSCFGWLRSVLGSPLDSSVHDTDALLLDLGEYFLPTLAPVVPAAAGGEVTGPGMDSATVPLPAASAATAAGIQSKDVDTSSTTAPSATSASNMDAAVAAVVAAMYGSSAVPGRAGESLQLYSILPRLLHQRAKLCSSNLTFREGTQQTIKSYFEAPGTGLADLSGLQTSIEDFNQAPLPTVTMVFAAVEGGKALIRKKPEVARLVHSTIGRLMHMLLMVLPDHDGHQDGYLCRQQEGVLKYMLAFREPARALEWALLLQEVMLHVPWPEGVLQGLSSSDASITPAEDAVRGKATPPGRPRIKIGMAEGHPDSITPDHLGRADYFGTFVNLAARMMDAAADGGLVVTGVELAERLYSTWRFEAELGLYDLPADSQHEQPPLQQQQQPTNGINPDNTSSQVSLSSPFANMQIPVATSTQQQQQQQQSSAPQLSAEECAPDFKVPIHSVADTDESEGPDTPRLATGAAAAGSRDNLTNAGGPKEEAHMQPSLGRKMSSSRAKLLKELLNKNAMLLDGPTYPPRQVHVSTQHIGTYSFKGCGAIDMVAFVTDFMPVPDLHMSGSKGGKGVMLSPSKGPVVGLQDCLIVLPNVLPALRQAWSAAAAAVAVPQQYEQDRTQLRQTKVANKSGKAVLRKCVSSGAAFGAFSTAPDGMRRFRPAAAVMDTVDDQPLTPPIDLEDGSSGSLDQEAATAAAAATSISKATRSPRWLGNSIAQLACGEVYKDVDAEAGAEPPISFLKRLSGSFTAVKPFRPVSNRRQQDCDGLVGEEQGQNDLQSQDIQLVVGRPDG